MSDKKDTRQPRLANNIEVSRKGEKVVGQINKRTGEIIGGAATPKPAKPSKAFESDK